MGQRRYIPHSQPTLNAPCVKAVTDVLRTGWIAQGKEVDRFEKTMGRFLHLKQGVATSSGSAALHLALLALNIPRGSEVIIPTYVCAALLNAVYYTGAKPVVVDVEEDGNISVTAVKRALTAKTKAIIVAHMFGYPADLASLCRLGVPVIEDCAQSLGGHYKGRKLGSVGTLAVCSFYATKVITTGSGGMVLSNHRLLLHKARDLREYDQKADYRPRFNYMMTDMQAALGVAQLKQLPRWIKKRKAIAGVYNKAFQSVGYELPRVAEEREHIYYRYILKTPKSASVIRQFKRKGVFATRAVFKPLHRYLGLKGFPVAEELMKKSVSLPIYPSLNNQQVRHIIRHAGGVT